MQLTVADHGTIRVTVQPSKTMLRVLTRSKEAKASRHFTEKDQFELKKGYGTRGTIGGVRMWCQRSLEFSGLEEDFRQREFEANGNCEEVWC